ncbi:DNA-formamidopyrimidine glycosylase [Virgibacillus halophilus]|uniref:DNA-formamidopyrimidine glycosylase n=1 Tax=Tigheibacillus halophilus TaxID=361280 RepID=UPI00362E2F76
MPELPEVETIKNTLKQLVIHKTIEDVTIQWPKIIKRPGDTAAFRMDLLGQSILNIHRRGKFLLFELDDYTLVSHLRMEGKYSVHQKEEKVKKHTHVIFTFTDQTELRYNDVRKFGTMHLFPKGMELTESPLNKLGPDPFDEAFTLDYFYQKLQHTNRLIKAVLLDQSVVAGLGNIYVDETLFKAGILPTRRADTLSKKETAAIRSQAIATITNAVAKGGSTIRSYVNSQGNMGMFQLELYVYGQENKPCKDCGCEIVKMKVAGRGTHVCLHCQK